MLDKPSATITEAEAQLYDRQIRLWGLDAQKRLRSAKILVAGMRGLGNEVAKKPGFSWRQFNDYFRS